MECTSYFSPFLGLSHHVSIMSGKGAVCNDEEPENKRISDSASGEGFTY
jgi:hypothetical protein